MSIGIGRVAMAAVVMFGLSCAPCLSQESRFYVEVGAGQASSDLGQDDQDALDEVMIEAWEILGYEVLDGESDLDKSGIGFSVALGYQFHRNFAVEAAFVGLGKATYDAVGVVDDGSGPQDAAAKITARSTGPALSLVGVWPVNESFSIDGRIGAFHAKSKMKVTLELDGESASESDSDTNTSVLYGIGMSWAFSPTLGIRLGYTRFDKGLLDEVDIDNLSLGVKFSF